MRFTTSQTSFKSGRLSPKLFNRIDTKQYKDGASICEGFRVLPEGGAERIKGKRWINQELFNSNVNFESSQSIGFTVNGIQKVITITIDGFNEVEAYISTYPYAYGNEVSQLLVSAGPTAYAPSLFSWAIVDNKVILCHASGKLPPIILYFDEDGTYAGINTLRPSNINSPFHLPQEELREETITLSNHLIVGNGGTVDLTSTDPDIAAELQGSRIIYAEGLGKANADDGNGYNYIASNYYRVVGNITNGVTAQFYYYYGLSDPLALGGVTTINTWSKNSWADGDYPKHVTTHEGRIVYGGTRTRPLTIFGSKVGDIWFLNQRRLPDTGSNIWTNKSGYTGELLPTDPYMFTISADEDSEITNLNITSDLFIGTDRKEYIATGGDALLSALSVQIKPYTTQGSYPSRTTVMESSVVYTDSTRRKVFAFKYNEANGSFVSQEISLLFGDLMEDDFVKELEWVPHIKALYILTDKGNLYAVTNDSQSETMAFYDTLERGIKSLVYVAARENVATTTSVHRGDHVFAYSNTGIFALEQVFFEKGVAESYVKMAQTKENEYLYLENVFDIVRTGASEYSINGQTINTGSDLFPIPTNSPVFGTEFRALNIDTGETVTIEGLSPDGGAWWLIDNEEINGASRIVVGRISDVPKIVATMPVEAGQQWGSAQLGIKNIDELGIRHYKSYSYDISSDGINWQTVRVADKLGNCTNGRENTKFSSNYKYDQIVYVRSTKPEPLTITGINMRGVTNDG